MQPKNKTRPDQAPQDVVQPCPVMLRCLPPLPPVRTRPGFSTTTRISPMANLRCTSDGYDLGPNDIAQLVFEVVVIALRVVLVEHEYDKRREFCRDGSTTLCYSSGGAVVFKLKERSGLALATSWLLANHFFAPGHAWRKSHSGFR